MRNKVGPLGSGRHRPRASRLQKISLAVVNAARLAGRPAAALSLGASDEAQPYRALLETPGHEEDGAGAAQHRQAAAQRRGEAAHAAPRQDRAPDGGPEGRHGRRPVGGAQRREAQGRRCGRVVGKLHPGRQGVVAADLVKQGALTHEKLAVLPVVAAGLAGGAVHPGRDDEPPPGPEHTLAFSQEARFVGHVLACDRQSLGRRDTASNRRARTGFEAPDKIKGVVIEGKA